MTCGVMGREAGAAMSAWAITAPAITMANPIVMASKRNC
jgi:hypothetical protein